MSIGFRQQIADEKAEKDNAERERQAQRRMKEQEEIRQRQQARETRESEEKARKKSIENYWREHEQEKDALLTKRQEAENAMKELGAFSGKEKERLLKLIAEIDDEFSRDR